MQQDLSEQNTENHNAAIHSSLSAGNDIHIGEKHIHHHVTVKGADKKNSHKYVLIVVGLVLLIPVYMQISKWPPSDNPQKPSHSSLPTDSIPQKNSLSDISPITTETPQSQLKPKQKPLPLVLAQGILMDDETGAPLEGVLITAVGLGGSSLTNKLGEFTLEVKNAPSSNEYRLRFYKEGYEDILETHYQIPKIIHKKLPKRPNNNTSEK